MTVEVDEDATPVVAGSKGRWKVFRDIALAVSRACASASLKRIATGGLDGPALARMSSDAAALAEAFSAWEHYDVGTEMRSQATARLFDMEAQARAMGVETWVAYERTST